MDINSKDQGSPQSRSILYFVGVLKTAMDDPSIEISAPSSLPFPDIDEFLDPITLADDPGRYPGTPAANANVDAAFETIRRQGGNPKHDTYIFDVQTSVEWRPKMIAKSRCPCMTYSRGSGLWLSNRGRRMSVGECLRIQGISKRKFVGVPDHRIREMVGNSMCVPTVSAVVKAAFRRLKHMHVVHDESNTAVAMQSLPSRTSKGERPVVLESRGENPVFLGNKSTWNNLRRVLLSRDLVVQARRQITADGSVYKKLNGYMSKLGYNVTGKVTKIINKSYMSGPVLVLTGSKAVEVSEPNGCRKILGTFGAFALEGGMVSFAVRIDSGVNPCDAHGLGDSPVRPGRMTEEKWHTKVTAFIIHLLPQTTGQAHRLDHSRHSQTGPRPKSKPARQGRVETRDVRERTDAR